MKAKEEKQKGNKRGMNQNEACDKARWLLQEQRDILGAISNKYVAQLHIIEGSDTAKISGELKSNLIKISVHLVKT